MSLLNVSGVSKKTGEDYLLKNIRFIQQHSQKIAIAGSTGSGKTTLLKIIAGLIQPDAGEILLEGAQVKGPSDKLLPGHPQIAYLSQDFELRANYRVKEILEMANKLSYPEAMLVYELCRIDHLLERWSDEISGGERQRIAFAKNLVSSPILLLLDEPFSNLDAIHRGILKSVIKDIEEKLRITCILVSHDPVDLLSWADEIIVLSKGKIIQRGTPKDVYGNPMNEYVAALFGGHNFISHDLVQLFPSLAQHEGRFIRPWDFEISDEKGGVEGKIERVKFMGGYFEMEVSLSNSKLIIMTNRCYEGGRPVYVSLRSVKEQGHHLE